MSLSIGYLAGKATRGSNIPVLQPNPPQPTQVISKLEESEDSETDSEADSDDEEVDDTGLESLKLEAGDECKLVFRSPTPLAG